MAQRSNRNMFPQSRGICDYHELTVNKSVIMSGVMSGSVTAMLTAGKSTEMILGLILLAALCLDGVSVVVLVVLLALRGTAVMRGIKAAVETMVVSVAVMG